MVGEKWRIWKISRGKVTNFSEVTKFFPDEIFPWRKFSLTFFPREGICFCQSDSCLFKRTFFSNDILLVVVKSIRLSSEGVEWRFLLFNAGDLLVSLTLLFCLSYLFCCWSLAKVRLLSGSTARKINLYAFKSLEVK